MPRAGDITATVNHHVPVRMRWRAGMPERLAVEPADTVVAIRGVDPGDLEPRRIPLGRYSNGKPRFYEAFVMEGVLWERVHRVEGEGFVPASLAEGLAILAGRNEDTSSPFRARIPERHRVAPYRGDAPIPPTSLRRASRAYHAEAADRVRTAAARRLAHDGRSVLVAIDQPLLRPGKSSLAQVGWALPSGGDWKPMFRHDRTGDLYDMMRTMGQEADIPAAREVKEPLAAGIAEAMRGVEVRDDDLRRFVNQACFVAADCLDGYREGVPRPDGAAEALDRLCALAAIDAVGPDIRAAVDLIASVVRDGHSRIGGPQVNRRVGDGLNGLRSQAFLVERYVGAVVRPRLAGAPAPEADAEALGALAP